MMVEGECFSTEKDETSTVDEELLITGVAASEENHRVLNGGVLAS
jgi:hypothetical protein